MKNVEHIQDGFCSQLIDAKKGPHCVYLLASLVEDYGVVFDAHAMIHESVHHLKAL